MISLPAWEETGLAPALCPTEVPGGVVPGGGDVLGEADTAGSGIFSGGLDGDLWGGETSVISVSEIEDILASPPLSDSPGGGGKGAIALNPGPGGGGVTLRFASGSGGVKWSTAVDFLGGGV